MKRTGFIFLILCAAAGYVAYLLFLAPNVNTTKRISVKIPTGSTYADVMRVLKENDVLKEKWTFSIVSDMKHYPDAVKPGAYTFNRGMNNRQIVNMLRMGLQTPVTLVIYNIRTKDEFAGLIGRTLELDSNAILAQLNDRQFCRRYGLDTSNILSRFMVDNYEFYWTIPEENFLERMDTAYARFWNEDRRMKAEALHLRKDEVITLASIVEKEVIRDTELTIVAGVYLNRLRINMPLQADPTLVFAMRDFNARRVNSKHKEFDSPYNTYMYAGLPPGPICMPRKKSIDAVLNADTHNYLYFCANPQMNGYSIFSRTLDEQNRVAAQYRRKMNEMNIH